MKNQTELTFNVDRQKIFTLADVEEDHGIECNVTFIDKQEELSSALAWLDFAPKLVGVDIETRGLDPHQHELIMFQFGDEFRQFVIDVRNVDITKVIDSIISEDITVVGQNLKFEYKFIKHNYKFNLLKVKDTMLQEIALYNGYRLGNSLKDLAKRYLNYEADKSIRMRFLEIEDKPFSKDEIIYGAYDVILPMLINKEQTKKIKIKNQKNLVNLEHNFMKVLGDMEYKGLFFDKKAWKALYNKNLPIFEGKTRELTQFVLKGNYERFIEHQLDMFDTTRTSRIQWTSSKQVIEFFRYLKICPKEISKTTKKMAWTVDAKVLKASLKTMNKDIAPHLKALIRLYLSMKEYEQRTTTFGIKFFKYINPVTGRLHSNFNQIVTTGRSSSRGPNLQNIPSDPAYRKCFTAPIDHKIVNADFAGQENIVLANKSLDVDLLSFYKLGNSDMHSFIASKIYKIDYQDFIDAVACKEAKIPLTDLQKELLNKRGIAKAAGFAINYGGNGWTISKNLGISEAQGEEVYEAYFNAFPGLKDYFDKTIDVTMKLGYVPINDITNRRLNLINFKLMKSLEKKPDRKSDYYKLKSQIGRLALNAPIQGTAGDITKAAGISFRNWIYESNYESRVYITNIIHDEINVEAPTELSEEVAKALKKSMEDAGSKWCKTVKLKADAQIKDYWTH